MLAVEPVVFRRCSSGVELAVGASMGRLFPESLSIVLKSNLAVNPGRSSSRMVQIAVGMKIGLVSRH